MAVLYLPADDASIRAAPRIAGGLAVGACVVARFALGTPPATPQRAFAVVLVPMGARMWCKAA